MSETETAQAAQETTAVNKDWEAAQKSIAALEAKVAELLGETKAERDKRRQAEQAAEQAAQEKARASGDIEALEKSWSEKLTARENELRADLEAREAWVKDLTVGQTATAMAAELAVQGSAKALLPHIKARLGTDIREGRPVTVVLDEAGKPSAMTVEELRQEIANDPAFAPLIVGTKASGAGGVTGKGGAPGNTKPIKDWTDADKGRFIRENGLDAWKQMVAQSA